MPDFFTGTLATIVSAALLVVIGIVILTIPHQDRLEGG